jgi:hypothetical protein
MALPNNNISVAMVRDELGAATNDVGQLCIHPNVNPLSKWKPIRHSSIEPITESHLKLANYGFEFPSFTTYQGASGSNWVYLKPNGGLSQPFRLTDFTNYDKYAETDIVSGYKSGIELDVIAMPNGITFGQQLSISAGSVKSTDFEYVIGDYYFSVIIADGTTIRVQKSASLPIREGGNKVTFYKEDFASITYNKNLTAHVVLSYNNLNNNSSGGTYYPVANFQGFLGRVPLRLNNTLRLTVGANYWARVLPASFLPYSSYSQIELYRSHVFIMSVRNDFANYPFPITINTFRFSYKNLFGVDVVDEVASTWGVNDGGSLVNILPVGETVYLQPNEERLFGFGGDWFLQGGAPPANGTTTTTTVSVSVNFNNQRIIAGTFPNKTYKLNINI